MPTPSHLVVFLAILSSLIGASELADPSCLHEPPEKFQTTSGNGKYFFIDTTQSLTLLESREECWKQGAHDLAMLHTFKDYETLTELAHNKRAEEVYIGLVDTTGAKCFGRTPTDCNSQLRWLDGQMLSYDEPSFHKNGLFEINTADQRSVRLNNGRFRDIWGQTYNYSFACEFNCNADLPPHFEPGVQRFGSVFLKIHSDFHPSQTGDPCPHNSQLFEPRDDATLDALRTLLAITAKEVVIGMKNNANINCAECFSQLTFLSDGGIWHFPTENNTLQSLIEGQERVSAKFNFYTNKLVFQSTEAKGLPFVCQINNICQNPSTVTDNQHELLHYNNSFVRYVLRRGKFCCNAAAIHNYPAPKLRYFTKHFQVARS